jgi:disulfide oxidoreductase YuzD
MSDLVVIAIVGAPVACADGVKESWRELAEWLAGQIARRYGPAVTVSYYDLFDPDCPLLPASARLLLVLVDGEMLTSGGKISIPTIRQRLTSLGLAAGAD